MELFIDNPCLVYFKPDEAFLLVLLMERCAFCAAGIDDWCAVDDVFLVAVEMAGGKKLELVGYGGGWYVGFLAKVALEPLNGIVGEEDVDVCVMFDPLSCKRVLVRCKGWVEAQSIDADSCSVEVELL